MTFEEATKILSIKNKDRSDWSDAVREIARHLSDYGDAISLSDWIERGIWHGDELPEEVRDEWDHLNDK